MKNNTWEDEWTKYQEYLDLLSLKDKKSLIENFSINNERFIDNKSFNGSENDLISLKIRMEKLISKDVKMRTFITT